MLGDIEQARDAAQETFIQAWRDLDQLRDCASFPAWLLGIAQHRCCDLTRRSTLSQVSLEAAEPAVAESDSDPAVEATRRQNREHVPGAIGTLSEANRVTTTLFHISGYTVREAAQLLRVPEGDSEATAS